MKGFYPTIPIQEYHAGEGYSSSQFRTLLKESPLALHYELEHPELDESTDLTKWGNTNRAMCIGGAVAAYMDAPHVFTEGYVVMDRSMAEKNKNTKEFKAEFARLTLENHDKTVILPQELDKIGAIVEAIHSHPDEQVRAQLHQFFDDPDLVSEGSWYWEDPETGILLKVRPDWCIRARLAGDLKTITSGCGERDVSKRILEGGYHIQAAMALDVINHVDQCLIDNWLLVFVEQSPPYDVSCWYLDKPTLALGYRQYRHAVKTLKQCLDSGIWPGKESGIKPINVPAYALNEEQIF